MITALALIFSPISNQIGMAMGAARIAEAVGPLPLDEIAQTITLGENRPLNWRSVIDLYTGYLRCISNNGPPITQQKN